MNLEFDAQTFVMTLKYKWNVTNYSPLIEYKTRPGVDKVKPKVWFKYSL